jgi:hypothetical protein
MDQRFKKPQIKRTMPSARSGAGGGHTESDAIGRQHLILIGILLVSAIYLFLQAGRDWIPHDEGTLAHAAQRILGGELPHRDFDDPYTGGLAMFHSLAFDLFGLKLITLRYVVFFFALAFVAAVYSIASRVTSPLAAGLVTLLCVFWSVPNYFAAMPSWYNLFFATFGTLALLRHMETDRSGWLLVAGLCGGLSILAKVSGLYFVAAALLFLVYREQVLSSSRKTLDSAKTHKILVSAGLLSFVFILIALIRRQPGVMETLHFTVPGVALVAFLFYNEWALHSGEIGGRSRRLAKLLFPFGCGVLLPVGVFLIPYAATSSLGALYTGVFVLPQQRFEYATYSMPPAWTLAAVFPFIWLLCDPFFRNRRRAGGFVLLPLAVLFCIALIYGRHTIVYQTVWYSLRPLVPLLTGVGLAVLLPRFGSERLTNLQRQRLFLLVVVAVMVSLVQFPFAAGIYFCYAAPTVILAIAAIIECQEAPPKNLLACCLTFYLLFAAIWLNWSSTYTLGFFYKFEPQNTPLDLERGGLKVSQSQAQLYQRLVEEVQRHSREGEYIFATPDAPEVYFLTDRKNPTRTFFDVFDADYKTPARRTQRILAMLEERQINVVVVRLQVEFARNIDRDLLSGLEERYPEVVNLAPHFLVRWRKPEDGQMDGPEPVPPSTARLAHGSEQLTMDITAKAAR